MKTLPRILFLSNECPHAAGAGAIVLHRLFRDYPADRLLVVTNNLPPASAARLACRYVELPLAVDRLNRTRFWPWRALLRVLGGSRLPRLGRVDRILDGFVPEVVLTLMQDSWYYDLAARYAKARRLPLLLMIHDLAHGFEPVPRRLQPRQFRLDQAVCRQAAQRWCISRGMADFFATEFQTPGAVLLPPRADSGPAQAPAACGSLKNPGTLTLGYAGGLHYGYGEQFLAMLPALRATGTVVEMFGPRPAGMLTPLQAATDVLHFNGYLSPPEEAWRQLLQRCDAVLQPYLNPAGTHDLQYRTHFPSKLGDCLTLGLPLLITGPAYASGVAWCREHGSSALVVSDPAPAALMAALTRLRDDSALRVDLATRAQQVAAEFAAEPLRAQLLAGLLAVSGQTP